MSRFLNIFLALFVSLSLVSCSSDSSDSSSDETTGTTTVSITDSAYAGNYKIDYTSVTSPASGKTTFTLTITDKDSRRYSSRPDRCPHSLDDHGGGPRAWLCGGQRHR